MLNQIKNPAKQNMKVCTATEAVKALFKTAIRVNIRKARPPKQAVMRDVCLKVMATFGSGFKKEKGHQIKSLSVTQL